MGLIRFEIKGRLPGLNEIIDEARRHRFAGAKQKKKETERCAYEIAAQGVGRIRKPVRLHFRWIEPNAKRDLDNIVAGAKFIGDGLVLAGCIPNDTRKWVVGFTHTFPEPCPEDPKIVVIMEPI